jgi:hypothetical protein|tara:strand:+ start:12514 stop:12678 length:165 start_codon:yes stop_codon:yes gene_type:complete
MVKNGTIIGAMGGFIAHLIWHNINNIPLLEANSHIVVGLVTVAIGAFIGSQVLK